MGPDLESRVLALLRYALDNPGETFRKADGMAWLGEASDLARELDSDPGMPPPEVIEAMAKDCRCCNVCSSRPCDACMAGGVCDDVRCTCQDEPSHEDDCAEDNTWD